MKKIALPEAQRTQDFGSRNKELTTTRSGRKDPMDPNSYFDSQDRNKTEKMRVVVYVNKPFIYTFLFQNRTDSLEWEGLYRSLHYQLAPLRKPLAASTTYRPERPDAGAAGSHIFDMVWDPRALTIHSTIPNIPDPARAVREGVVGQPTAGAGASFWSTAEAISTHSQILTRQAATLSEPSELERTCKTSRGWWVVWTRVAGAGDAKPSPGPIDDADADVDADGAAAAAAPPYRTIPSLQQQDSLESAASDMTAAMLSSRPRVGGGKEIFLIRRAGSSVAAEDIGGGGGGGAGASRLAQGIGVDTKKYVEGLLSVGR
jgi:hypothetical protein